MAKIPQTSKMIKIYTSTLLKWAKCHKILYNGQSNLKPTKIPTKLKKSSVFWLSDANLNQHALRPNKQYWNNCPRKLKFRFWWNLDPMFISEMRTKSISNRPWPNDYNWITNQRYKVWMLQGRIPDKFTVLEEPKEKLIGHKLNNPLW